MAQLCALRRRGTRGARLGRPDISRADFTWCMIAIDRGWSVEEAAARLLEQSSKARENKAQYAVRTARRAAATSSADG